MGVGPTALRLYWDLIKHDILKTGQSVCELGAQDMMPEDFNLQEIYNLFPQMVIPYRPVSARQFMASLGFTYQCIDLEDRYGALQIDLNHAKIYPEEHYDIITNHGTSEHIFNQANCFQIIHDLCKQDGVMIHISPHFGQEQARHGLYCYCTSFYNDLAAANRYQIIRHYIDEYKEGAGYSLIAVLKKRHAERFRMPIQGCYEYLEEKVDDAYRPHRRVG